MTDKKRFIPLIIAGCVLILISVYLVFTTVNKNESYIKNKDDVIPNLLEITSSPNVIIDYVKPTTAREGFYINTVGFSNLAVVAEFDNAELNGDMRIHNFKLIETIYGNAESDDIKVCSWDSYIKSEIDENVFTEGKKYLLILQKENRIIFDDVTYTFVDDCFVDLEVLEKINCKSHVVKINSEAEASDVVTYIADLAETKGFLKDYVPKIYRDKALEDIVTDCDLIAYVKVKSNIGSVFDLPDYDYTCEPVAVLSGEYASEFETIMITAEKGKLEIGESYLVLMNKRYSEDFGAAVDKYFVQAHKDGIIHVSDEYNIEKIEKILQDYEKSICG